MDPNRRRPAWRPRALALVLALTGFGVHAGTAAAATFIDPMGDSGTTGDITTVDVTSDAAGNYRFVVAYGNRPTASADDVLLIFLDTDKNPATGDPTFEGAEYWILIDNGERTIDLLAWNGTEFVEAEGSTLLTSDGRTISINRSDLGNSSGFNFRLIATNQELTEFDFAPDANLPAWTFDSATFQRLQVPASVSRTRAGRVLNARLIQFMLTTGERAQPDGLTCTLRHRGKVVKPLAGGCRWRVTRAMRGRALQLTVRATVAGATVTRTITVRVAR